MSSAQTPGTHRKGGEEYGHEDQGSREEDTPRHSPERVVNAVRHIDRQGDLLPCRSLGAQAAEADKGEGQ
jgi:hypothetical protein